MKKIIIIAVIGLLIYNANAQTKEISYTLDDRDRLIRVEEQIKALNDKMDARFEAVDAKFGAMDAKFGAMDAKFEAMDDKINKLYTLIYFVLGGIFGLIGLILWDRRSYIKPVKEDINQIRQVLRKYAETNPELKDILNKAAI